MTHGGPEIDLEATKRAFGGLLPPVDILPGINRPDLSHRDPYADPDADADAATRGL